MRKPRPLPVAGPRSEHFPRLNLSSVKRKPQYVEGPPRPNEALTTGQVANALKVSIQTVIRWIDGGVLKGHRIPASQHRRVFVRDVLRFAEERGIELIWERPT